MAPATYSSASRSAPLGVKVICVLGAIGGIFGLFAGVVALGASPLLGLFAIGLSLVQLFVIIGLWNLESWAWTLAMLSYGLSALLDLVQLNVLGLLISVVIIAYLASKSHLFR